MRLAALILALAACGASESAPPGVDAGATVDASVELDGIACSGTCDLPDADPAGPDAADGSLPEGASCDPLRDECELGLTCRIVAVDGSSLCRPVGPLVEGGDCAEGGDAACGYAMQCTPVGAGRMGCVLVCSIANPQRCSAGQSCWPFVGDEIGFCQ